VRAQFLDEAIPGRSVGSAIGEHLVGSLEKQPIHAVELGIAAGEFGDVAFGFPARRRNPVMLCPEERRPPCVRNAQDDQFA
jgi:hypothetical protein